MEENKKNGKKKLNDLEIHIETALKELNEKDEAIKEMEKDPLIMVYNNRLSERQQQKESILESYKKLEKKRKECGHSLQYLLDYQHGREESKDQLVCKCVECKRVKTYIYGEERIEKDALNFWYVYEDDANDLSFGGAYIFIPRVGKIDVGPSYEELRKEFFELLEDEMVSFNCTVSLYHKYKITNNKEISDEMIIRSLQKNRGE